MKEKISFFLNGSLTEVAVKAETTVLELLRNHLSLQGIKEGCGEGDCGACTVVIGEVMAGKVHYKSATGCLYLAAKLEGKHLITIEGLSDKNKLHPIQEAILNAHATQCGFCTPGVSLSILALYLNKSNPTKEEFRRYLEGNLCRCTGYTSLRQVPKYLEELDLSPKDYRPMYLSETENKQLTFVPEDIFVDDGIYAYYSPVSKNNLISFLSSHSSLSAEGNICYINGGSDVVVGIKKRGQHYRLLLDLSRISSMQNISWDHNLLYLGGSVSLSSIIDRTKLVLPELAFTMSQMCSEQVRQTATLSGNIVNASPVADTVPLLLVLNAQLHLANISGIRTVPIREFYHGYKITDRKIDEWISSISIPLGGFNFIHFEKVSKRREVDISAINSAIALQIENGVITKAHLACGGVGPTTVYMSKTSRYLEGKELSEETFLSAYKVIQEEALPIGDVRGSAEYRKAVMQNLLMKHYLAYKNKQEVKEHA